MKIQSVVFCDNLIDRKVDPDFEEEFRAATEENLTAYLISFETLSEGNVGGAIARVKEQPEEILAVYRGWMIAPERYNVLYQALLNKKIRLINGPSEYKTCHYLPLSYLSIKDHTPLTTWTEVEGEIDFEKVFEATSVFKNEPIIVKDFVKSQKHHWEEACFIPDASDKDHVRKVVTRFIELQGDQLNEGLVFRKFEDLAFLTRHSKSNMPLTKEYRLFFLNGELIQVFNYWDEGDYGDMQLDLDEFRRIAKNVKSNFFTMDIAQRKNGTWIIMELGDGQVSGLPDNADKRTFYLSLKQGSKV